ncbi:MAG: hypothetical protein NC434_12490, partial [Ruminococcus sp.]|nr:hypothetical protein [Ruminococcus sp.]
DGDSNEIDEKQLEIGILKQLFYSVDSDRIPQSRYRKLQPEKKWRNPLMGLLLLIILCGIICFIAPDKTHTFFVNVNALAWWEILIVYIGLGGVSWYVLTRFAKWFEKNGNIKELQILDKATLTNEKDGEESIFNKNMDEIVYFFETTKTELVIIEDLDRFKSTNIFVALRELNNILNHYEKIEGRVKFVYAIKDDMFEQQGERTKFFDFIIPIVPYISSTNSGEMLRKELQFDDTKNISKIYDISGNFISLISPYVSDMRDLTCICNEFNIFKNTLKGNQQLNLLDEHMFALIVFKNLQPKEFANLEDEKEESVVKRAFSDKKKFVESRETLIEVKKQEETDKIKQIENEALQSVKELKLALITSLVNFQHAVYQVYNGTVYVLEDILSDDFEISIFKGKQVDVYWREGRYDRQTRISDVEDLVRENGDYFTRIECMKKGLNRCKEQSRCVIEEYEKKINELKAYPIRTIIEEFGIDFLDESVRNNKLLVFLLRHGYLDENYESYINYFHPKSISKEEMNFILGVRNHSSEFEYTYSIKNVAQVFARLLDFEYKQKEVLNFDLVDYVLSEKMNTESAKMLIEQLSDHTEESMSFIKAYVERGENIDKLLHCLCKKNTLLWKDITEDNGIPLETRYKYLVLLLKYADIDDLVAQDNVSDGADGVLTKFLRSYTDVLKNIKETSTDKQVKLIEELGVVFSNVELDTVDEKIREEVFGHCRYELNSLMLQRLFEWKAPERVCDLQVKNYTTILQLDYQPLTDYVHDYFTDYITDIVLGIDTNENENIDVLEDILERLLPENEELCFKVLEKEKAVWNDIKYCCKEVGEDAAQTKKKIWDFLLSNNRIQCTWNNFIDYYEQYGSELCWAEYFDENINILLNDIDNPIITEGILSVLMFADITEESFRKYISSVELKPYEESLTKLNEMKIKIMIEEGKLPYNVSYWDEMGDVASECRVPYAERNRNVFIASLDDIELKDEEINSLLQSELFIPEEKKKLLSKLDATTLGIETAKIVKDLNFKINRIYTDAAWSVLDEENKYALLLNQIDAYKNEELPDLFSELAPVYHQLVERTRHKFKFAYNDYNKKLLDKLVQKDYITSAEEEWVDKENHIPFNREKEHIIVGYVKQLKE